jgi:hypothetical protein
VDSGPELFGMGGRTGAIADDPPPQPEISIAATSEQAKNFIVGEVLFTIRTPLVDGTSR